MLSLEIAHLVYKEKIKDLRRDAERQQWIKTARLRRPGHRESLRKMAGWIGSRMVTWGSMLRRHESGPHQTVTQRG
ncbi:MAG: hypothetical protein OES12_07780 [Anaerolineae bacterium]|nr:hypothetical protein [Anaerolineae bacterium]